MGNYITIANLEDRIVTSRLATFVTETGADRTRILTDMITRAEDRLDGYLGAKYQTPVTATGYIKELSLSLAEYEIFKRGSGGQIPEKIRDNFKDIMAELKALSKGELAIGGAVPLSSISSSGCMEIDSDDAEFQSESLSGGYL